MINANEQDRDSVAGDRPHRATPLSQPGRPRPIQLWIGVALVAALLVGLLSPAGAIRSPAALRSAPIPSICGQPAGRLVDGVLPGLPPQTAVELRLARIGRFGPTRGQGGAASLFCSFGAGGQPDTIVFYDSRRRVIGSSNLGTVTGSPRPRADALRVRGGKVIVTVGNITLDDDALCCGTGRARVVYRWSERLDRVIIARYQMLPSIASFGD